MYDCVPREVFGSSYLECTLCAMVYFTCKIYIYIYTAPLCKILQLVDDFQKPGSLLPPWPCLWACSKRTTAAPQPSFVILLGGFRGTRLYLSSNLHLWKLSVLARGGMAEGLFVLKEFKGAPKFSPPAPSLFLLSKISLQPHWDFNLLSWACACRQGEALAHLPRGRAFLSKRNVKVLIFKLPHQLWYLSLWASEFP